MVNYIRREIWPGCIDSDGVIHDIKLHNNRWESWKENNTEEINCFTNILYIKDTLDWRNLLSFIDCETLSCINSLCHTYKTCHHWPIHISWSLRMSQKFWNWTQFLRRIWRGDDKNKQCIQMKKKQQQYDASLELFYDTIDVKLMLGLTSISS